MTDRLLVYPLLFLTVLQLVALVRQAPHWSIAPIIHRLLILLTGCVALLDGPHPAWVVLAWVEFVLFSILPPFNAQRAMRWLLAGEFQRAAGAWRAVARFNWSRHGRAYRQFADALQRADVESVLQQLDESMPVIARGEVKLWRLAWLTGRRDWQGAIACYEAMDSWGSLPAAMQARLAAARAYAELGWPERALRCLLFIALSPRTVGALATQLWMTRVAVTALAGDAPELERLLANKPSYRRYGFARFAATWRGRCAARRGDRLESGRQLSRALALTPASLSRTRAMLAGYLEQSENCVSVTEQYRSELARLQHADAELAEWRALLHVERPTGLTLVLLGLMTGVFALDAVWFRQSLWEWLGNVPLRDTAGQWWRPVTALFLHANLIHWGANMIGLWMFGMAIERTLGGGRMLVIFLVAGVSANVASASIDGFDVSVGASGGIFGLVAAFAVTVFRSGALVPVTIRRRLLWLIGAMVTMDFVIGAVEAQIDSVAHAGGFAAGLALAWLLRR